MPADQGAGVPRFLLPRRSLRDDSAEAPLQVRAMVPFLPLKFESAGAGGGCAWEVLVSSTGARRAMLA